ncbi:MAG: hypothetical protein Q8P23_00495, partial [bacterium]|nr:hypothetical protein [bacterium]
MIADFFIHHFRVHLEPKAPLPMPADNKGNVIRGGFGCVFRSNRPPNPEQTGRVIRDKAAG